MHRRREVADLLRKFLAHALDAPQQFAILRLIHQRDQPVSNLKPSYIHRRNVIPARVLYFRLRGRRGSHLRRLPLLALDHHICAAAQHGCQQQKGNVRHARYHAHETDDRGSEDQRLGPGKELVHELAADVVVGSHAAHDQARGGRDDERRNLCNQSVTDCQQGVVSGSGGDVQIVLQHTDDQAAYHIDEQDQDARYRIAPHKLAGAIHRTVESASWEIAARRLPPLPRR